MAMNSPVFHAKSASTHHTLVCWIKFSESVCVALYPSVVPNSGPLTFCCHHDLNICLLALHCSPWPSAGAQQYNLSYQRNLHKAALLDQSLLTRLLSVTPLGACVTPSPDSDRLPGPQLSAAAVTAGPGVQRSAGVAGRRRGAGKRTGAVRQGRMAARTAPLRRLHAARACARACDAGWRAGERDRGPPAPDLALAPRGPRLRGVQGRVGTRTAAHCLPMQLPPVKMPRNPGQGP